MVLNKKQIEFLEKHQVCRFATVSKDAIPRVTPVIYALDGENVVIAVDYGTKKLANCRENENVSLVVDEIHSKMAVIIQGRCKIHEKRKEYFRLTDSIR